MASHWRPLALVFAVALLALSALSCARRESSQGPRGGTTIQQIGSTTLLPIAERWAKVFHEEHPEIRIALSGGGSGTGIKALIAGTADIANSSRKIKQQELEQARQAGVEPVEHIVAYDGIAAIVNPKNPVRELSLRQLSDIYCGAISNWRAVGGEDREIVVVGRDSASGTYEAFKELVVTLGGRETQRDYCPETLQQASNQAVVDTVAQSEAAIGYVGLGYVTEKVKALRIAAEGGEPVAPTVENVASGAYPISRALYMYTRGQPQGAVRTYLQWCLSEKGQAIVRELGFVPVSEGAGAKQSPAPPRGA